MELPLPPVPALTPQTAPLAIAPVASHPAPTQSNAAAFESAGMVAPPAVHPAEVRIGEFESQPAVAPPSNSERLRQETSFPQFSAEPDRRRESGLAQSAGFDQAPAPSPVKRRADTPLAGFGNASPPAQAAKPRALAEATPFDTARTAAPVPPPSVPHTGVGGFTPVEILSKPRPQYTEDGRRARVEGEITLEVLFAASGKARVLRTLNTLGHGLDESALRAAEDIRFRPATRGGSPEDTVATVRIDFRLAY
jgi:TonB family protein